MTTSLISELIQLIQYHKQHCKLYSDYVDSMYPDGVQNCKSLADLPYVPVRAFKEMDLFSIPEPDIFKVMYSSGTTGKQSKIYLDKDTAKSQSLHLTTSFKNNFGGSRFPMLVIDSDKTRKGRTARSAAVNGFSLYSKKRCFALDENMNLKLEEVQDFLEQNKGTEVFVFGFTFVLYQYFFNLLREQEVSLDLSNAFVLHGGGWKKLQNLKVADEDFKALIKDTTGCTRVHNYYGMIEQTGSIYFECSHGRLHAPHNGSVITRSKSTLEPLGYGEEGLIQVFSTIQKSYPGHSLLTEDVGVVYPGSDCGCGNSADIVEIRGRLEKAEIRGCSDAV
ncbi:Acyl-protein synthetase, LuxE [Marinobacterium sp. xm-a-121]|uniref:LuxE/PaaK family acyltransferase n=1 Tax=unclassified Marinobacterium TaxID=2644139 RepID=UPI0015690AC8|nr:MULTISPECIES: long-chain fatty acid--CoA ligase [unclassified Marinobacterium]NRP37540.1 Acyl-protein synthetase, LuxE [Marinobacterium sp. xm-a-121]NRP99884.1 Acyl-protein synthetase, LuxE [Marinobacterium sp. xm-v-233]